jgi:O-antigen ligase
LLFAALFIVADSASPFSPVSVEDWDADFLATAREGTIQRQVGYALILLCAGVMSITVRRKPEIGVHRGGAVACGAFLAWALASALWSEQPAVLVKRLCVIGIALFWFYTVAMRWSGPKVVKFAVWSTFCAIAVSVFTETVNGRFTPFNPEYRLSGTLAPNSLGLCAMVLTVAALAVAVYTPKHRRVYLLMVTAGLLVVVLTKSRTALIGLVISGLMVLHLAARPKTKVAVLWLGMTLVLFVATYAGPSTFASAAAAVPRGQDEISTLSGRIPMWQDVIEQYASKRPFLGYGFTTFWTTDRISRISEDENWGVSAAHSAYLEVVLDLGLPGLLLYLATLAVSVRVLWRRLRTHRNASLVFSAATLSGLCVIGLTESELPFRTSPIYFYGLIALLLPFVLRNEDEATNDDPRLCGLSGAETFHDWGSRCD